MCECVYIPLHVRLGRYREMESREGSKVVIQYRYGWSTSRAGLDSPPAKRRH